MACRWFEHALCLAPTDRFTYRFRASPVATSVRTDLVQASVDSPDGGLSWFLQVAIMDENGLLRVITFTARRQPFVVRCEQETRVRDIVQAIAESWGFRDAAPLFTLCKPSPDCLPYTSDVSQLLRGASLLASHERPCKACREKAETPSLVLVRSIFGGAASAFEQNQAVLTLTAAQVAADISIGRYPPQADGNLLNHIIQQGQPQVVLQMAAQWQSGEHKPGGFIPCLVHFVLICDAQSLCVLTVGAQPWLATTSTVPAVLTVVWVHHTIGSTQCSTQDTA